MPDSAEQTPRTTLSTQPDSHYAQLKDAMPRWLGETSSRRRQTLGQSTARLPQALRDASANSQSEFKRLAIAHWNAQNKVEQALAGVLDAQAFAEPILTLALKTKYGLDLDVKNTFLRLYIPLKIPGFALRSGASRTWTVSLLDAALHNFEHKETLADAYERVSTFVTRPDARGLFDTLPATKRVLSIQAFTQLCRDLDIGAQYESYLQEQLGMTEPVAEAVLQFKVERSHKAELHTALHWALLKGDLQPDYYRLLQGLVDSVAGAGVRLAGQTLSYHDLSLMGVDLPGIIVFAPDLEQTRAAVRIVAYVPGDPEHPIKEYASAQAMHKELVRQLRSDDYQRFFSRFVAHEQRGHFFANLSQLLGSITWHPFVPGSNLPSWRETPTDNPRVRFVATPGSRNLWRHQYQRQLNQILNDGRTSAVATATVDRAARWALWDSFVNVASAILQAAAFVIAPFVPFAGELMLGYMAYQLLDEVFEGIIDWSEGQGGEAVEHLLGAVQALVQLGGFAVGSKIAVAEFRKVLPQSVIDFIDRFKPVQLANGRTLYWKPDLAAYEQPVSVPAGTYRDPSGLFKHQRQNLLPLDDKFYAVEEAPAANTLLIQHPTRADAYRPSVQHNGQGAWHTELERPLQWGPKTLLQRLGHSVEGISDADQALALSISGVDESALRKMHVNSHTPPALLMDTLDRLRVDRDIQTLIDRLRSDDPAAYAQVDPQANVQLLTTFGYWPETRRLQFIDAQGKAAWAFGDTQLPAIEIPESQLNNGDLLKAILTQLPAPEAASAFGAAVGDLRLSLDVRTGHLRKKLAAIAEDKRASLFESHYANPQATRNPRAQRLMDAAPGLPACVAEKLLEQVTAEELQALDNQNTPQRLSLLARNAFEEVRLSRAYEGLYFGAQTLDSQRLALHSLPALPGWSAQVRLELRDYSATGSLRDQIGAADAPIVRTLVRSETGQYTPYDERGSLTAATDFYSAILSALPDSQRQAIQLNVDQGPRLRQHIRQQAIARNRLREILSTDPLRKPTYDPETMKLLGGMDGYQAQAAYGDGPPPLTAQLRELFPSLADTQIQLLLEHMQTRPEGAANQLALLREQRQILRQNLLTWQADIAPIDPDTQLAMTAGRRFYEQQSRRLVAEQIEQCWRRETDKDEYFANPARNGHTLRLYAPGLADLPELGVALNHVSLLSLISGGRMRGVEHFLLRFPKLRHLELRSIPLADLPPQLSGMRTLNSLTLSDCNITLTAQSHARLSAMSNLHSLDLHSNPLGLVPDVRGMPELIYLDLSATGIDHLPDGLVQRPIVQAALLSDNQISALPQTLFSVTPDIARQFNLSGNPLRLPALEQIKAYCQAYGEHFNAQAPSVERSRVRILYPTYLESEADRFVFSLPGNMAAVAPTLTRIEAEYAQLVTDLQHWALNVPDRHPILDTPLDEQAAVQEQLARLHIKTVLEEAWRRESEEDEESLSDEFTHSVTLQTSALGPLPELSATFEHVSSLEINGGGTTGNVDGTVRCFGKLETLTLNHCVLGTLPTTLPRLARLTTLSIEECSVTLTTPDINMLGDMTKLEYLSLTDNPLSRAPNVSNLSQLTALHLRNTGISEVPHGVFSLPYLETIDLSNNLIREIPADLLESTTAYNHDCDLSANPLSPRSLNHLRQHYVRTGIDFQVDAATVDEQGAQLVIVGPTPMEE
ncbi:leucine-rich repeat domain-containing protein [Pseudomonas sp. MAFF 730085]|uniref:Leucine-rich repeat domain-containing protein n=1 Tax=Pseudomonas kitaguniensis TaxID=2607908 RepID=A0A5N7JXX3_9PSED|nr:leucine-rich repeat domain-containing protein [Pseudomonas kitaguniensis]MPQ85983.1 leucine-rich repeat domain-containing protein [Pseudomonas kitaguniensis]